MQKLFGKHEYIPVSISQLTNNGGRTDPNRRMGGDEVVQVRFIKITSETVLAERQSPLMTMIQRHVPEL